MKRVVVLGAGPAGLAAAHELARAGRPVTVLERERLVGGLARTEMYRGFRFDIGGHRFYTKSDEVRRFWVDAVGPDLLVRPRLSRIYYRKKFFQYPLQAMDTLRGLGAVEAALSVGSYLRRRARPLAVEDTFEGWVTNRFGDRVFRTFFKSYTEKVWGIPCSELRAEWAAQRIKGLSLGGLLRRALGLGGPAVRSLIERFHYPRLGPGMMWEAVARNAQAAGAAVRLGADVVRIERTDARVEAAVVTTPLGEERVEGGHFITSLPLRTLVRKLDPAPPEAVRKAAEALRHRDYLTVCLILRRPHVFPDNWIYVHDPSVRVARIQNYKNWSGDMVPDPARTSLGLEYFCQEGDDLWSRTDPELVDLAARELRAIGLAEAGDVEDGCVFRVKEAYPVYDSAYCDRLAVVRSFIDGLANCQTIGRNGLHRYNNQDHAVLSGLLAARNLLHGRRFDVWSIGSDADYFEEEPAIAAAG
jgi:protoporphyrinogen oxidase